jgi:competence protein ComEC
MSDDAPQERLPPRRPALIIGVGAVAGCALAAVLEPSRPWLVAGAVVLPVAGLGALLLRGWRVAPAALMLVAVFAAFFVWAGYDRTPGPGSLAGQFPEGAEIARVEGVILEGADYLVRDPSAFEYSASPDRDDDFPIGRYMPRSVSYLLSAERLPDLDKPTSGVIRMYAPPGMQLVPGTRVSLLGRLRVPRQAGNPAETDTRARFARRGITHTMSIPEAGRIKVLERPSAWAPASLAYSVHLQFHRLVGSRVSEERAAVLGATLLGERGNLSPQQREKYVRSGTVHLLVVSGLHVGLLTGAIVFLLRLLGVDPRWAWGAGALAALLYLGITGVQPSVLRATVMLCVYALGRLLLVRADALNVLGTSAFISLLLRPGDVAELGFQLSFLAVLGIFVLAPVLRVFAPIPPSRRIGRPFRRRVSDWAGSSVRASVGVGLATWPLLVYTLHIFSPIMIAANLVAAPLLTLMLVFGLMTPLALIPGVAPVLAFILGNLAGLLEWISGTLAAVPYGHFFWPAPPLWWLVGYYVLLVGMVALPRLGLQRIAGASAWLLWLCLIPFMSLVQKDAPGPVEMTALSLGHGQCIIVEVPDGPLVMIDCGSTSMNSIGDRIVAPYLWSRGRTRVDALFLSHVDADHVNGLDQLFERFEVGVVYVSEIFRDDDAGRALYDWLGERTEVRRLCRGDVVTLAPGLELRCLWPDVEWARGLISERLRRNEGNLVLELRSGDARVLMPSDAETPAFAGFLPMVERADVLFAPHQGSRVTGLPWLLEQLQPGHVVISTREGFPAESSLEAYKQSGAEVWKTYRDGAVTFTLGADGSIAARGFLESEK